MGDLLCGIMNPPNMRKAIKTQFPKNVEIACVREIDARKRNRDVDA